MAKEEEVKECEIEFISYGKNEKIEGSVWWNGKKVDSDSKLLLGRLKVLQIKDLTIDDGVEFLEALPARFRSYLTARKVL
jgi:hypothetical protein